MTARPRMLAAGVALVVSAASGVVPDAAGAVLCRKRSGRLVVAEACGRKQRPVSAVELGLVGPPAPVGTPGAPGEPGILPYRVVDARGRRVGAVLSILGELTQVVLTHPALSVPIQLGVEGGRIVPEEHSGEAVYYEAVGCTGAPFISGSGSPLPRVARIRDVLFYSAEAQVTREFASRETEDPICSGGAQTLRGTCCRTAGPGLYVSGPATAVSLVDLDIVEPLALEERE